MPNTYTLIASVTVGSGGASSIDFTSIPSTYTDLLVKLSGRANADVVAVICSINSSALDSGKRLRGDGSTVASASSAESYGVNNSGATASTFSNAEWYFPNYAGNSYKSVSMDAVAENNGTAAYSSINAGLENTTSAISSLSFAPNGGNFVQYSTAYLYGIKNS